MSIRQVSTAHDEPYSLDPEFERAVVYLCCASENFWSLGGHVIDPALLGSEHAKLVVQACGAIARDTGRPPCGFPVVFQRLRSWVNAGKYTLDVYSACGDYLDAAHTNGVPNEEAILGELVPLLRKRMEFDALESGLRSYQGGGSLAELRQALDRIEGLGVTRDDFGTGWGTASAGHIVKERCLDRLLSHIPELDEAMGGGFKRKTLTTFMASTGVGKTFSLAHMAVAAAIQGLNVAVATLEVPSSEWHARVHACACGVELNDVTGIYTEAELAEQATAFQRSVTDTLHVMPGAVYVNDFNTTATPADIHSWILKLEERKGVPFDVTIVDYADKLQTSRRKRGKKSNVPDVDNTSTYHAQGNVYDELFDEAKRKGRWVLTATQAVRSKELNTRLLTEFDGADSQNKARIVDQMIGLNRRPEGLVWNVCKSRYSPTGAFFGPIPTCYEVGRIVPIVWVPRA